MQFSDILLEKLGIYLVDNEKVYCFVDFGNVNKWFDRDVWRLQSEKLKMNEKLVIDLEKLGQFLDLFCIKKWFYYGLHQNNPKSLHITIKAKKCGFKIVSKDIQWIKHYLPMTEKEAYKRVFKKIINSDDRGCYIKIPKCNFDVEICMDAIRLIDNYNTFCLLSSDNNFSNLLHYLKRKGKKIILIKSGPIASTLKNRADVLINAQAIKSHICSVKTIQIKKDSTLAEPGNQTRILG